MSRLTSFLILAFLLPGIASCSDGNGPSNRAAHATTSAPEAGVGDPPGNAQEAAARHHGAADDESLPLLPIMLQMAADMSGLMQALWLEDFEQMSAHAAAVAGHPGISAGELERIEAELGPEMADFVAVDEAVHRASVRLHEAAEAQEMDNVLAHLDEVQRGCVDCHSRFRERLSTRQSADP